MIFITLSIEIVFVPKCLYMAHDEKLIFVTIKIRGLEKTGELKIIRAEYTWKHTTFLLWI